MDKPTAAQIIADPQDLYMNAPVEYPYVEKITQREESRLKSFLINVFAQGDDGAGDAIRNSSLEAVVQTLLDNNFTFDTEYYGYRPLPKGVDGKPISKLDDPEYQRKMGFRS
jgi:hypothetical protein